MAGTAPERALDGLAQRVIPGAPSATITVGTSSSTTDLSPYAGKTIALYAKDGDIFIRRGTGTPTATTDDYPLLQGTLERFFIDPTDTALVLAHIASSAGRKLLVYVVSP